MIIHTKSRIIQNKTKYEATAEYAGDFVTVRKGSKINRSQQNTLKGKRKVEKLWRDDSLFEKGCILKNDITFKSLSTAATFVTGHVANGNVTWKCENGRSVGEVIKEKR